MPETLGEMAVKIELKMIKLIDIELKGVTYGKGTNIGSQF